MSSSSTNKLKVLWDHFIQAEPQGTEKSRWLDIFLAELLAQVKEGHDAKDALSFCSVGEKSIASLIGCELLADVHQLCESSASNDSEDRNSSQDDGDRDGGVGGEQLRGLSTYLASKQGWRCLAVLHLLGIREISCNRELVGILLALYPLLSPEDLGQVSKNPYFKFKTLEDGLDRFDITLCNEAKNKKKRKNGKKQKEEEMEKQNYFFDNFHEDPDAVEKSTTSTRRRRKRRVSSNHFSSPQKNTGSNKSLTDLVTADVRPSQHNSSSESEALSDEQERRSLPLKIRLNPMDFEYFTSVVRSEDELGRSAQLIEAEKADKDDHLHAEDKDDKESLEKRENDSSLESKDSDWEDMVDDRIQAVFDSSASQFELSLVILQILLISQEPEANVIVDSESSSNHLKFSLDTLWSLQFGSESTSKFSGLEIATLKATAARLMLVTLERILQAEESMTAVINNGLLPMTLKLLEDACSKPVVKNMSPEEGSLLQEYMFANLRGIVTFLYALIHHQRGTSDKLKHFYEIFQLLISSHEGKLLEKAFFTIIDFPSSDSKKSFNRAQKVIDMIGVLINSLKRLRQSLTHVNHCKRTKHKTCLDLETCETHHHLRVFSDTFIPDIVVGPRVSLSKTCTVSSFFLNLTALLRESHSFPWEELQLRLLKVMAVVGTCCCFPPKLLLSSLISFLKKGNPQIYIPTVSLIERTLYGELGAYPHTEDICTSCSSLNLTSWKFLDIYADVLNLENVKLCRIVMKHLLKVTPLSNFEAKQELFFSVFYPTFVKTKALTDLKKTDATTQKFIIQSCLTAITNLIMDATMFKKFIELDGLTQVHTLLPNQVYIKNVYPLMEVAVIMEIKSVECKDENAREKIFADRPVTSVLFGFLVDETKNLLEILDNLPDDEDNSQSTEENLKLRSAFHQASGVWRAAAGVALFSPKFRLEFDSHDVAESAIILAETLAALIASDRFKGGIKFALRLLEAVITCCLISSVPSERDIVNVLGNCLMDESIKLNRGITAVIEILLQVSILKPSHEQPTASLQNRTTKFSINAADEATDFWGEPDDSSFGEYMTADDGYEADIENFVKNQQDFSSRRFSQLGTTTDVLKGAINADPALCSLAIHLLIYFAKQGLNNERIEITKNGLRKVGAICKESTSTCAALAGSGEIMGLLEGFKDILENQDSQYQDLQNAILEIFALLAMQAISSTELLFYLNFFKISSPPIQSLLKPLNRLLRAARPQPNYILSFPMPYEAPEDSNNSLDGYRNMEKAENIVNNFRRKHLENEVFSPWSIHAICLPIGSEMSWPVWLSGCSVSLWLRVERGNPVISNRTMQILNDATVPSTESDSLSDWGLLGDNFSRDFGSNSSSPPSPTSVLHMMSIGFESLVLETWLDLKADKLILRLTRPDDKANRTISETAVNGQLPSGRWHHLAMNFKDTVINKNSAVVEVIIWVDGWKEIKVQLPFDGLLIRRPGTTCVLMGQTGQSTLGAWYLSNVMIFRCPIFTCERALYIASLGPNFTNLANCVLNNIKPDFAPLIASGALRGVRELRYEGGKFDEFRRKSFGGLYFRHAVEVKVSDSKINWNSLMDQTNSHLSELQDYILLIYETQSPNIVHLYPQLVASANVVKNLLPAQPGFRVLSDPDHKVAQQPPLTVPTIILAQLQHQTYKGLVSSASLIGGMPIFLYLFARVVELNSTEEEQALAISIVLNLARSDSDMFNQYRSEGGASLLFKVLESPRCHAGKHMLKAILDAACDSSILIKDVGTKNLMISQNSEAVITDPELIKCTLEAWRTWAMYDSLNLLLQAMLYLLKDQHPQREFNASQLNRIKFVETMLVMCKEHFLCEEASSVSLDPTTGSAVVELARALMGAPPEFPHLVLIIDYLILVHQASDTYVTHSRYNMYFLLTPLEDLKSSTKSLTGSSSNESINIVENSKLFKALTNVQIQKENRKIDELNNENDTSSAGPDTSAGEDSGIAASEGSNQQFNEKQSTKNNTKKACQGLICEGLLLLLRDALRVLPDSQVPAALKHVLRVEVLLVLANNPDARVRTALIKLIHVYLQRANDELVNKFIKLKYFIHLANQISLYPGSEPLVVTLEHLALKGPSLAAIPPVLAMIPKAAATDLNVAKPLVSFVTDLITKNPNALKILLEQGLIECLSRGLVNAAHVGNFSSLYRDFNVLFVTVATKLLESPGNHHMQAVTDIHVILNHAELKERSCGFNKSCISVVRDAQVALFDGELDVLTAKVDNHSGFRLKSATSYLATAPHLSNGVSTSSEQSDQGSRSPSINNLNVMLNTNTREPNKGEFNERFKLILNRAVDFLTTTDELPSSSELQLTKRLFSILLHGISSPLNKKTYWVRAWSVKPALRKNTAKIMVWLMAPHQNLKTRVYTVRSLMEEPKTKEILSTLLEVHPQVEQKFSAFLWDLLQKRDEMPSADALICEEMREALKVWELAKSIDQGSSEIWIEEVTILQRELLKERDIWIENQMSAIQRIITKNDPLAKQLIEGAMGVTRIVHEEQSRERKTLMEKLKHSRALEAQAMAKWRDLAKRLTHERAPWYFEESYPRSWELDPTEGPARVRTRLQRCHLNIDKRFFLPEHTDKLEATKIEAPLSYLFTNGKQDANATALIERLHTSERIRKMAQARVVTPQAELLGEALIGETCFYFVPDNPNMPLHTDIALGGLDLAMAGGTAWRLEDIRELHRRRYQLQEKAIEIFLITGRTYLLAFNSSKERDQFALELSNCNLPRRVPGDDLGEAMALWRNGALTNWEYITCLNKLAGRSYNDLMQYPVFPFVLADYISDQIDLNDPNIYRNFKRPMAVQDKKNEPHYVNNYNYLKQALSEGFNLIALNQEPFHYGSHYSNSGTVLHFLVRLPPYTSMFLNYQDDNFDIPDRTFHALATTWRLTSCDSTTDVKELIPEFFYLPEFLINFEGFNFGIRQSGSRVGDVELPKWCGDDARLFVLAHRAALESEIVREVLPYWIDLVFGFRQTGKPAVEAINVFHPATYYGFNVEQIEDPLERQAWETMVKTYGQTPAQLFKSAHPLPAQNLAITTSANIPKVIDGVDGIRWGNFVGAPGNDPMICWRYKHKVLIATLTPLSTGDVFGLPICTALVLAYSKDKGNSMLSSTSVLGAALISWNNADGIVRLKTKKEQPPKPLIKACGLDTISIMKSSPDCGYVWIGYASGRIVIFSCNISTTGKIDFKPSTPTVLLAHRSRITAIELSRPFSIAVTGDRAGVVVIWDLNSLTYVRSIIREPSYPVGLISISETLGDIAVVYQLPSLVATSISTDNRSELVVYTINARLVGSLSSKRRITALCYSNAVEGVSVNVIATGLDDGMIRLWSSWDLKLVREMASNKGNSAIVAITWSCDQHHLYVVTEDCTVIIWEGARKLSNGTPKFVNLSTL